MFSSDKPIAASNPMIKVSFEQFLQLHLRQKATEVGSGLRVEFYSGDFEKVGSEDEIRQAFGVSLHL